MEWQRNEQMKVLNGQHAQVRRRVIEKQIEIDKHETENIRRQRCVLKQIEKDQKSMMQMAFEVVFESDE